MLKYATKVVNEEYGIDLSVVIEDDVMVTVNYLVAQGLIEVILENDEYFLTEIPNLIGSETASTRRSRKSRATQEQQKMLQCNNLQQIATKVQRRDRYRERYRYRVRERGRERKQIILQLLRRIPKHQSNSRTI